MKEYHFQLIDQPNELPLTIYKKLNQAFTRRNFYPTDHQWDCITNTMGRGDDYTGSENEYYSLNIGGTYDSIHARNVWNIELVIY